MSEHVICKFIIHIQQKHFRFFSEYSMLTLRHFIAKIKL